MTLRRTASLSAFLVVGFLVLAGIALAAKSYPDRPGDVTGGSGPDMRSISISNTATTITFHVRFAKSPPLRVNTQEKWSDMLLIAIDVPPLGPRPVAPGGEWRGANFALGTHGPARTGQLVRLGERRHPRAHDEWRPSRSSPAVRQ